MGMTIEEQIMKLQTYKMFEDEDTVYVERDDILELLKQQPCEDYISRDALLDNLEEPMNWTDSEAEIQEQRDYEGFIELVKSMPSITPSYNSIKTELKPCEDCISREQTLKAFAEKCGGECACCKYNGSGYDTAENCKLIKSMPSVTPQQQSVTDFADKCKECGKILNDKLQTRMIPVSERLPEEGQRVVVVTSGDYATVCLVKDNDGAAEEVSTQIWFYPEPGWDDGYVAWMPFEPYKESEGEE